jgi:hypothetical protein
LYPVQPVVLWTCGCAHTGTIYRVAGSCCGLVAALIELQLVHTVVASTADKPGGEGWKVCVAGERTLIGLPLYRPNPMDLRFLSYGLLLPVPVCNLLWLLSITSFYFGHRFF